MPAEPPSPAPAAPSKFQTFLRRLGSTVLLWAVVLGAMFFPQPMVADGLFFGLMLLLTATGLLEFYCLVEKRGLACFKWLGLAGGLVLMAVNHRLLTQTHAHPASGDDPAGVELGLLALFVLALFARQLFARHSPHGLTAVATTLLGIIYVPWLLNFMQKLAYLPGIEGRFYLLHFILVTKFSDLGAYCTGSLIGRHKMIPRISPGKTWEGFAGAIVISTGTSVLFVQLAGERMAAMSLFHAAMIGVILGVMAVVGDLIESLFKREAGVKDSGKFFPGIGGILDLLDSLLFNAPLAYLYLRWVVLP